MKKILALMLVATGALAQEQEQKLVDRLLKPNTTLENSAQKEKFVADGASIDKRANVSAFHFQQKENAKTFAGMRDYSAKKFQSKPYAVANDHSMPSPRSTSSLRTYSTSTSALVRASRDAKKSANTREFAGQRPFLDRGKSEKSVEFQRTNKPMTIEDVRELLNKNKERADRTRIP